MTKQQLKLLACITVAAGTGLAAAPPSVAAGPRMVHPGESIQAAVNAAKPGDVIRIAPGTYRESVLITKPGLTLRGSGSGTVLVPGNRTTKPAKSTKATKATKSTKKAKAAQSCAKQGNGICVLGTASKPVRDVQIRSLALSGFKKNGVWASGTDRLVVQQVVSEKNGTWGIAQEKSVRGVFRHNTVRANGDSGIMIANVVESEGGATDTRGTVVQANRLEANRIGVTLRRVRNLAVIGNEVTGNCGGVFVVGDENKPAAGQMTISGNQIHHNNKSCAATARMPALQGAGIVLTGSQGTLVRSNTIQDNVGKSPYSGGIVLFKSFVGAANSDNAIRDNVVQGNKPADLAGTNTGSGNTFERNRCGASQPTGTC
ncbi:right-handed parallel beta-helix repeat-containing protein [Streptomyces sp. NBC_00344]|uniref:right-handed parallel beta-helix repeat-containing protein n=1 Tax=Streptomyces sp. NBC_00344 TaxID=2975720 RepID=UPI002E1ACA34